MDWYYNNILHQQQSISCSYVDMYSKTHLAWIHIIIITPPKFLKINFILNYW
jgi:hypothetical protein